MLEKLLKRSSLAVKLIMFSVTALFLSWCTFLSIQALDEAEREAEARKNGTA